MSDDILAAKRALRRTMTARRDGVDIAERAGAATSLAAHVMQRLAFPATACIAGYFPFRSEFDVLPLLRVLHEAERTIVLPVIVGRGKKLVFRRYRPGDPMHVNALGIPEPGPEAELLAPTHLLVPLLAFDDSGYRLGYGGGYYDRTLSALREAGHHAATIGIGFDLQHVDKVPRLPGDQRLELIATERDFYGPLAGKL
ncbi:MAG: 5-formyltetrahydrofolate cyclo-ligase [Reyranellaceae bacterium]